MKTEKLKTKIHHVTMSREEMSFALLAFQKVYAKEHFMAVRIRLMNALQEMGMYAGSQEWHEATKQFENIFSKTMENQTK